MRRCRPAEGGFSLLEVMVSIAIVGMALVVLFDVVTNNVRATSHARMVTAATFLARTKIAELEDMVLEEGFVDNDQQEEGDFSDAGFPQARWMTLVERIELPIDLTQQAQEAATDTAQSSDGNPLSMMTGFLGGFMSTLIEPIRTGLEESVRRVTVKVTWDEVGKPEQSIEVVTYMTDPAKLEMALPGMGPANNQNPGDQGGGQQGAGGRQGGSTGAGGASGGQRQGSGTQGGGPPGGGPSGGGQGPRGGRQ